MLWIYLLTISEHTTPKCHNAFYLHVWDYHYIRPYYTHTVYFLIASKINPPFCISQVDQEPTGRKALDQSDLNQWQNLVSHTSISGFHRSTYSCSPSTNTSTTRHYWTSALPYRQTCQHNKTGASTDKQTSYITRWRSHRDCTGQQLLTDWEHYC